LKKKQGKKNPWKGILHFTQDGCLYIDDDELADKIEDAIKSGHFCIQRDDPDYEVVDDSGGGIGGYGTNMQCPC
jgi:hypothetical protein